MYIYVKNLLDGDVVAGFIAAVFFITNLSLLVDREVQAVLLIDDALLILPCLVAFTIGLKKKSLPFMALSGFFFVLTYATFPNPRISIIALLSLMLTALYLAVNKGRKSFRLQTIKTRVKPFAVFLVSVAIVSVWIVAFVFTNLNAFLGTYGQLSSLTNYNVDIKPVDTLRLIAYWGFYGSALGKPYVPYANVYYDPFVYALSFVPTVLAFEALIISKNRKAAAFFTGAALLSLALTNGVAWGIVTSIPLMMTFRLTTNWIFFTVFAFSILIGLTVSALYRKTKRGSLKILTLILTCTVLFAAAYPLFTGDIAKNWMDDTKKGTYVPAYFNEANNVISDRHYTLLLPQRIAFVTYNFTEGMMSCGNPYPLIFSKPYVSGVGTEYVQSPNTDLLNKIYDAAQNDVAHEGTASASSSEDPHTPSLAVDGNDNTQWTSESSMPQYYEIDWNETKHIDSVKITFQEEYANDYTIQTAYGTNWINQTDARNSTSLTPEKHTFPQSTPTTKLRINFTKAYYGKVSISEIQVYDARSISDKVMKTLGILGIKNLLVENNIVYGNLSDAKDIKILNGTAGITLIQKWNEASLYKNEYAQEMLYPADNIMEFSDFFNMTRVIDNTEWSTLQHSAFLKSTSSMNRTTVGTLKTPESFSWTELSPTSFKVTVKADGPFLLVFLESYNTHWKASVNGQRIPEANHAEINGFANGWLVNATGNITITVEYETQNLITAAGVASVILTAAFAIIILLRKNIAKTVKNIIVKLRRKPESLSA